MFRGFLRTNLCTTMNIFLGIRDFVFLFFRCACDVAPMISQQVQPPALGGSTAWQKSGSEWVDPFGPIWVFQGPNCPKIKLMGSPPISNLIIVLTTIFPKTFTATCSGASIASSGELPANFRRSSDEPSVMLLRTSGKLLDLRRSTWRVLTSFFGKLMDFLDLFL